MIVPTRHIIIEKTNTIENWFIDIIHSDLYAISGQIEYPNSTFYIVGTECLFDYNKMTSEIYCSYTKIWSVLKYNFKMNDEQIVMLIKPIIEKYLKLINVIPIEEYLVLNEKIKRP